MSKIPRKKKRPRGRKRTTPYTLGEINRLIDGLIHPLAEKDKAFTLLDGVLHALNERDPPQSLRKFMKYNLPELIRQLEKSSKNRTQKPTGSSR